MARRQRTKQPRAEKLSSAFRALRGPFAAVVVFSFFINLLMLVAPMYMLQVYDRVLSSRNETTLLMLTIIAVGLLIVFGLLELVRSRVLVRVGLKFDEALGSDTFRAVFKRAVRRAGDSGSQPLRDLDSVRDFLTGQGLISFCDAPWVPVFLAVIYMFHPVLGMVATIGAIVIFSLALLNEVTTRQPLADAGKDSVTANSFVTTSLRNAEAVSAMGMMPGLMRRWRRKQGKVLSLQSLASDRSGAILASSKATRMCLQVAMLGTGAYLAIHREITPGTMIAGSILMGRALAPVESAVGQWRGFIKARNAMQRLNDLLLPLENEREPMRLPAPKGELSAENAVVVPPGTRTPVLRGVRFKLAPGEAMGVIGPSGAGKSSMARALTGVWPVASGAIRLDGADLGDWDREQLGPYVGYLPQDVELFEGTVAENIARFQEVDPDEVVRAAKRAGAHETVLRLPQGYDTEVGASGQSLSGGQRQRIGLARALYGDVRIVLLDEPDANLDSAGEKALVNALAQAKQAGVTMVMITHRPPLLGNADKVLALDQGQVQAFGPRDEVLQKFTRPASVEGQQRRQVTGEGEGGGAGGGASSAAGPAPS